MPSLTGLRLRVAAGIALVCFMLTACTDRGPQPSASHASSEQVAVPREVAVPKLVGSTTGVADRRLRDAGLHLEVHVTGTPEGLQPDGWIVSQKPSPGGRVSKGSVVTVDAVCTPKPCPSPIGGQSIYDPCTCATR
jgi:hypothetical protein